MKKLIISLTCLISVAAFTACGLSEAELAAKAKITADSLATVQAAQMMADSIAAAEAAAAEMKMAAEKATADSLKAVFTADSLAAVAKAAGKKVISKPKPVVKPMTKAQEEVKVKEEKVKSKFK
jgi:hypothetical protein